MAEKLQYGQAICAGFEYLLAKYPEVFVIGQGLWSPWYVGSSMTDLDKKFGKERVIDTPVSEDACTGAGIGASLTGTRPIVIHPRMDFMVLAVNQLVNQAAKWSYMLGGQAHPAVTVRGIINRGGEQGPQHSQALHAWFAHVPGLRVVMPATAEDARDLLVASVLCDDPVLYIDDRWCYDSETDNVPIKEIPLSSVRPKVRRQGGDMTIAAVGYPVLQALEAADRLQTQGISCEVIDLRMINPLDLSCVYESVRKTGRLCAVDGGTFTGGFAAEVLASVVENVGIAGFKDTPLRLATPDTPAPTSKFLEEEYYAPIRAEGIAARVSESIQSKGKRL